MTETRDFADWLREQARRWRAAGNVRRAGWYEARLVEVLRGRVLEPVD